MRRSKRLAAKRLVAKEEDESWTGQALMEECRDRLKEWLLTELASMVMDLAGLVVSVCHGSWIGSELRFSDMTWMSPGYLRAWISLPDMTTGVVCNTDLDCSTDDMMDNYVRTEHQGVVFTAKSNSVAIRRKIGSEYHVNAVTTSMAQPTHIAANSSYIVVMDNPLAVLRIDRATLHKTELVSWLAYSSHSFSTGMACDDGRLFLTQSPSENELFVIDIHNDILIAKPKFKFMPRSIAVGQHVIYLCHHKGLVAIDKHNFTILKQFNRPLAYYNNLVLQATRGQELLFCLGPMGNILRCL